MNKTLAEAQECRDALPIWFLENIGKTIHLVISQTGASFFAFSDNAIHLSERWANFERTKRMLHSTISHEMGHAYHYNTNLIDDEKIDGRVRSFYREAKELIQKLTKEQLQWLNSKQIPQNTTLLQRKYENKYTFAELYRLLAVLGDLFASLTAGELGFGHPQNYWQDSIRKFQEFFANSTDIYLNGNPILADFFPEFVLLINLFWDNEKDRTTKI